MELTQGIVLRTIRFSESSLIVHWLTEDHGRVSTMARGATRPKSAFRGKLDLFYECQINFQRSSRYTLHTLREISLNETFERLRRDVEKINQASYVAQLTSKSIEEDTPVEGLFERLLDFLTALNQSKKADLMLTLYFEFQLLQLLGLEPQWRQDRLSLNVKEVLESWTIDAFSWSDEVRKHTSQVRMDLFKYLGRFMAYHLGLPPKLRTQLMDTHARPCGPQDAETQGNNQEP